MLALPFALALFYLPAPDPDPPLTDLQAFPPYAHAVRWRDFNRELKSRLEAERLLRLHL